MSLDQDKPIHRHCHPWSHAIIIAKNCTFQNDDKPLAGSDRELSSFPVTLPSSLTVLQLNTHTLFTVSHKQTRVQNVIITIQLLLSEWHPSLTSQIVLPQPLVSFCFSWRQIFLSRASYTLHISVQQGSLIELGSLFIVLHLPSTV